MKAAAAYREAFPLSSRPRLIEAALLSHQAQLLFRELGEDGAPAKQSAAYQTATRDLVTYLEASRALLDLEPSARLIRIDLLGRAGAYGSVRTEVEAVASAYPRMSQAYARAARYVHPGSVESVSALRELGRVALLHAPEAERLKTYARIQLALADAWTSRLYSDTLLDRDAFHAGLVELLNAHPDPRLYSQAAMIACDNRDHHLARLVLQRLEVVPAEQIVWDLMKGHVAFDRCRRTVIRNYRNASQGP
jgi:hypothetical protein